MRMWRNKENSQPHVPVRQATSTDSGDSLLTQLDRTTSRMKQSPNIGKGLTVAQIIGESRNIRQQFTSGICVPHGIAVSNSVLAFRAMECRKPIASGLMLRQLSRLCAWG